MQPALHNDCCNKGTDMPPKPKVTKEQIIDAALNIVREKGIEKVTAREVGKALDVSSRPVFTYYDGMDELKADLYKTAMEIYESYVNNVSETVRPLQAFGHRTLRFIYEEPELFKMLAFSNTENRDSSSLIGSHAFFEKTFSKIKGFIIESLDMTEFEAKCFYRHLWIHLMGLGMLIISGGFPYSEEEIKKMMSEECLAICKAYKEIPALTNGKLDPGGEFAKILKKKY